jgi:hypothetical protein
MVKITYTYDCCSCYASHKDTFLIDEKCSTIPNPHLSEGWRNIEGDYYCPTHKISLTVDGVEGQID